MSILGRGVTLQNYSKLIVKNIYNYFRCIAPAVIQNVS